MEELKVKGWPAMQYRLEPDEDERLVWPGFFDALLDYSKSPNPLDPRLRGKFLAVAKKYRLEELVKVERTPGAVSVTLANLWRLTRSDGQGRIGPFRDLDAPLLPEGLSLHSFDLAEGRWRLQSQAIRRWIKCSNPWGRKTSRPPLIFSQNPWPDLRYFYEAVSDSGLLAGLLGAILEKILWALGWRRTSEAPATKEFVNFYFFRQKHTPYKLPSQVVAASLRRVLDRELMEQLEPLQRPWGDGIRLSQYLAAHGHEGHLRRINRETPNLAPLLNLIPTKYWSRNDLWQDQVLRRVSPFFSQVSPTGLRWLRKQPMEALDQLGYLYRTDKRKRERSSAIDVFASLRPSAAWASPPLRWAIYSRVWRLAAMLAYIGAGDLAARRRLAGLLARYIEARWAAGERNQRQIIFYYRLRDFCDWFRAEGSRQGLPDKNSTWVSLERRSERWHRETLGRNYVGTGNGDEGKTNGEATAWESALGRMEIDGIKVNPLTSGLELAKEGAEMSHCVGSYADLCRKSGFRVFSLTEPNGTRSTLSLRRPEGAKSVYVVDQHKGKANGPVSRAALKAARELCRLYAAAELRGRELPVNAAPQAR